MGNSEKILFKNRLKHFCLEMIEHRIAVAKRAIEDAREVTNQEEKSTVGDKYETARAMGQLEQDMYARQLAENIKEVSLLQSINTNTICSEAGAGAFIQCGELSFFIAAGLGKHVVDGTSIFFLSPNAPLARTLMHKKSGNEFVFNGVNMVIRDLY
jgi:hypothetical protein